MTENVAQRRVSQATRASIVLAVMSVVSSAAVLRIYYRASAPEGGLAEQFAFLARGGLLAAPLANLANIVVAIAITVILITRKPRRRILGTCCGAMLGIATWHALIIPQFPLAIASLVLALLIAFLLFYGLRHQSS